MKKSGEKFQKLEYRDFYSDFAKYALEQNMAKHKDVEYFDVSDCGDGELLVVVRFNGKTVKYTIHVLSLVDENVCDTVLEKLVEISTPKIEHILYKLVKNI